MDRPGAGSGGGYQKLGLRKALEISLVNAAAFISLGDDGRTIKKARVALGAVAPVPMRAPAAEKALLNKKAGPRAFALAAPAAADEARPISDHRGSAQYRREMVKVLVGRALDTAWQNARGK
jgi:carbon-monoxide dehydrogenase medium subunit